MEGEVLRGVTVGEQAREGEPKGSDTVTGCEEGEGEPVSGEIEAMGGERDMLTGEEERLV